MANSRVAQHMIQIVHNGAASKARVAQHMVQVVTEAPTGIRFTDPECTDLFSLETLTQITEVGLSWAVLNNSDASAVTSILDKNNTLNIDSGEGFIQTDITPGTYIVIVQNGTGSIGAYVMNAN